MDKKIICTKENPLYKLISKNEKAKIKELSVAGFLGIEDCKLLSRMSRYNKLHTLDLSGVTETETEIYLPLSESYYNPKIGITDDAFVNSIRLEKIIFPEGIKAIGNRAFSGCINLKNVEFPDNVFYGELAFQDCPLLNEFYIGGKEWNDYLNYLSDSAFSGSVKRYICDWNRWPLNESGEIVCNAGFYENFSFEGSVFFFNSDWNDMRLLRYPAGNDRREYVVPEGVESIWSHAFSKCRSLQQITFPESCDKLTVKAITDCPELNTLIFRSKSLEGARLCHWDLSWDNIITNCPKLKDIYLFAEDPRYVDFSIFERLENLCDIVLHVPCFSAKKYKEEEYEYVLTDRFVIITQSSTYNMETIKEKVWQKFKRIEEFDPIDII